MRPNIFHYTNYLDFLRDWLAHLKKSGEPRLSLRELARAADLSPAAISIGINGKQTLSEKTLEKILGKLQLNFEEIQFLRTLRRIVESPTDALKLDALNEAIQHPQYQAQNKNNREVYDYLSNWVHVLVHEMSQLPDFDSDPKWIQNRSVHPIPKDEILRAVVFLEAANFLERDENGNLRSTHRNLKCDSGVFSISLHHFHRSMLQLAEKSIKISDQNTRNLQGLTIQVSDIQYAEINKIINESLNKIEAVCSERATQTEVYHMEFALFPLTRTSRTENT